MGANWPRPWYSSHARSCRTELHIAIYRARQTRAIIERNSSCTVSRWRTHPGRRSHAEDLKSQDTLNALHLDFKRANGYSELEISGKRQAIENVLIPETANNHLNRLTRVGFTEVTEFFHCLNFKRGCHRMIQIDDAWTHPGLRGHLTSSLGINPSLTDDLVTVI